MGLFGKKKTPEEIVSEGRAQYIKGDLKKAFITLHGLAAKGNPQACYYIGKIYLERKEKNLAQSFLTTAAKSGIPDAAELLAKEFSVGEYLSKDTVPEADVTVNEAFSRGSSAYNEQNYLEALNWWEKAAELGEVAAQHNIGYMYHAGVGAAKNESKAFYWYRKAAEGGHPGAQYNIGVYYLYGVETPVDKEEALKWFRLAAEQGDESAKKQLISLTSTPETKINPKPEPTQKRTEELSPDEKHQKGMELFQAGEYNAAFHLLRSVCKPLGTDKNKFPDGQAAIGQMYEQGYGVEADDKQALWRYRIAAGNGNLDGMSGFVRLIAKVENPSLKDCEVALDYVKWLNNSEMKDIVPVLKKRLAEAKLREKYAEWELNEANVQAIFNRCLATMDNPKTTTIATLFAPELGYELDDDAMVIFDTKALLQNKRNIAYLYGQLKDIHSGATQRLLLEDFSVGYSGKQWTQDTRTVLQLMYLGVSEYTLFIEPFRSEQFFKKGKYKQLTEEVLKSMFMGVRHPDLFEPFRMEEDTSRLDNTVIKSTLSPEDPKFPEWWEIHKGEWENSENANNEFTLEERLKKSKELFDEENYKEAAQITESAHVFVLNDECMGAVDCGICKDECKEGAVIIDCARDIVSIDNKRCTKCGKCADACPMGAIEIQ